MTIEEDGIPTLIGINYAVTHNSDPVYTYTTRVATFATQISELAGIPTR